jgi:hypothetical protein
MLKITDSQQNEVTSDFHMEGVCSGEQYVQKYVSKSQGSTCYTFLNQTCI